MENTGLIIGLTGRFGAGCTTTARFFKTQKRFSSFSLSTPLKKVAINSVKNFSRKKNEEKREILQNIGDDLRKRDYLAIISPIIKQIKKEKSKNVVIECLRNHYEVEALRRELNNFFLIAVDAETEIRWKRLEHIYDGKRKEFDKNDKRDAGGDEQEDYGQQVKKCIEIADILVNNEDRFFKKNSRLNYQAIDNYGQKLSDYLRLMREPGSRKPNLDELYMHYACSVALKSNCLRRQVGAVIVKEKYGKVKQKKQVRDIIESYVVATGRNNVPTGEADCEILFKKKQIRCYRERIKKEYFAKYEHCRECGEELKKLLVCKNCGCDNLELPGKMLDLCRAVHAEEAAILQAANLGGMSLNGTKVYTSTFPCMLCCKDIIASGIEIVVYLESYPMEESLALNMFRKCGIGVQKFEGVTSRTFNYLFKNKNKIT